jgi:hypothetical protein
VAVLDREHRLHWAQLQLPALPERPPGCHFVSELCLLTSDRVPTAVATLTLTNFSAADVPFAAEVRGV